MQDLTHSSLLSLPKPRAQLINNPNKQANYIRFISYNTSHVYFLLQYTKNPYYDPYTVYWH